MITRGTEDEVGSSEIRLQQGDAQLELSILAPQAATWEVVDTATARNPWDSPNRGTCMVAFTQQASADGELTLAVLATPGGCGQSEKGKLKIQPFEKWGQ